VDQLTREFRLAELRALMSSNPRSLVERYCEITGALGGTQLPHVSFSRMVEAILAHEEATEKSAHATD
jgi:hypothetical protein